MRVGRKVPRTLRFALTVVLTVSVAMAPGAVLAFSGFGDDWEAAHVGSSSYANADCELCHADGDHSMWNRYGYALLVGYGSNGGDMSAAIATVDTQNSDGDVTGSTNAAEATADTQPGWTYGPNNTIYDSGGTPTAGVLPPAVVTGLLDPVTLVKITDDLFTPSAVAPKIGGVVQWVRGGGAGDHNVAETNDIFRSGNPTTGAIFYNRAFSAGTFAYACEIHPAMTGTVKVKPKVAAAPAGATFTVTWATARTNTGTRFDVQYRIGSGTWRYWLRNTSLKKAVFGANGSPTPPVPGTTYAFHVRSGTGTVWSGWSPQKGFVAA